MIKITDAERLEIAKKKFDFPKIVGSPEEIRQAEALRNKTISTSVFGSASKVEAFGERLKKKGYTDEEVVDAFYDLHSDRVVKYDRVYAALHISDAAKLIKYLSR